jgi:hypothetical protein
LELNSKKRGSEKINSTREKIKVTHLRALPFSLLMKRRTMAPKIGKKISSDRMGIPKMVMKPAPFFKSLPCPLAGRLYEREAFTFPFPREGRQKGD